MQKRILRLFWRHTRRYPRDVLIIATLLPITVLMHQFLPPLVIADMLQHLSSGEFIPGDLWGSFGGLLLLYAFLRITSATIMWRAAIVAMWQLEAKVTRDINKRIFKRLLRLSLRFHADNSSGSVVAAASRFTESHIQLTEALVMQFIPLVVSFIFVTVILLPQAPLFVICLLIFAAIYITITILVTRTVRDKSAIEAAARSDQTGLLADSIANVMAVKSFAASQYEEKRFAHAVESTKKKFLAMMRVGQARELYFSVITSSITTVSIVLAIASAAVFGAKIATVFLVVEYTSTLVARLWEFSNGTLRMYNRAIGNAIDMADILDLTPEVGDPVRPERVRINKGTIQFKDVTFTHAQANEAIFRNFNLTIQPGQKIGLVGHSGAGKSTLVKLLLRFSDIDKGQILIDDQNIAAITQDDLRRYISYVPQEPLLFHRSVKENIAYGTPNATNDAIYAAARKAHALEFIKKLPNGFDTIVGERGIKLSGGQRQRLAIARAILKDAPILVLDEATSALDSESEKAIQAALRKLMQKRTTVAIAHRLSTIQRMDRIIVLRNGRIIEDGSHAELLARGGVYAKLWHHQSGGFLES
jgi:ATP-binding cassette subfamily B protein